MKFLKNFKQIKSFSILLVPDHSGSSATSYKLTTAAFIIYLAIYTLAAAFIGFLIFGMTPIDRWIFGEKQGLSDDQMEMVSELNEKMLFLTKELESLKSTNERLRYAIILGDSSLIDSLNRNRDTSAGENKIKKEGNILAIFRKLFFDEKPQLQSESYYFSRPVIGFISRRFDPGRGHMGIDFVVKTGTAVSASASGYVVFSDFTVKSGYMMIISHSEDYISVYKHCSALIKKERENVVQGELIALSGNSGEITTGPHLHFEIWKNGKPIDPEKLLINY